MFTQQFKKIFLIFFCLIKINVLAFNPEKDRPIIYTTEDDKIKGHFYLALVSYPSQQLSNKYISSPDWLSSPAAFSNLIDFVKTISDLKGYLLEKRYKIEKDDIDRLPIIFINGSTGFKFTQAERTKLRKYLLEQGGFLYISDNNRNPNSIFMKLAIEELEKILPDNKLQIIPATHPIYSSYFKFDGTPLLQAFSGDIEKYKNKGIIVNNRLVVLLSVIDYMKAWEPVVKKKTSIIPIEQGEQVEGGEQMEKRKEVSGDLNWYDEMQHKIALKFGLNILVYALGTSSMVDTTNFKAKWLK